MCVFGVCALPLPASLSPSFVFPTYALSLPLPLSLSNPHTDTPLQDPEVAAEIRGCFAGLHAVGPGRDDAAEAAVADALARPEGYVLKPQREGGGNNFYGEELAGRLREAEPALSDLSDLILMQRIMPPIQVQFKFECQVEVGVRDQGGLCPWSS